MKVASLLLERGADPKAPAQWSWAQPAAYADWMASRKSW